MIINKLKSLATLCAAFIGIISTTSSVMSLDNGIDSSVITQINEFIDTNQELKEWLQGILGIKLSIIQVNLSSFVDTISDKATALLPKSYAFAERGSVKEAVKSVIDTLQSRASNKVVDLETAISFVQKTVESTNHLPVGLDRLVPAFAQADIRKGFTYILWLIVVALVITESIQNNFFRSLAGFIRTTSLYLLIVLSIGSIGELFQIVRLDVVLPQQINQVLNLQNLEISTKNIDVLQGNTDIATVEAYKASQDEKLLQLIVSGATTVSAVDLVTNDSAVFGMVNLIAACFFITRLQNFGVSGNPLARLTIAQREFVNTVRLVICLLTLTIFVQFIFRDESVSLPILKLGAPIIAAIIIKRDSDRITSWVENEDNCSVTTDQEGNKMYFIIPDDKRPDNNQ